MVVVVMVVDAFHSIMVIHDHRGFKYKVEKKLYWRLKASFISFIHIHFLLYIFFLSILFVHIDYSGSV